MNLRSKRWLRRIALVVFLCAIFCGRDRAQTFQFLPEVDFRYKFTPDIRFLFQAKETREASDPTQAEIGPSLEFLVKPLLRSRRITKHDPDESKTRLLVLSAGYRDVSSPDKPDTHRLQLMATSQYTLFAKLLLADRNRFDLDWSNGDFTWRYRNRLKLERRVTIGSYHPAPHVHAEVYYQSQYQKWTTTALNAGCLLPLTKRLELDPYYEHQNVTSKAPNKQYNQFGLILNMYF